MELESRDKTLRGDGRRRPTERDQKGEEWREEREVTECPWSVWHGVRLTGNHIPPLKPLLSVLPQEGGTYLVSLVVYMLADVGTRGLTLWKLTDVDVRGLTPLEKHAREGRQTRDRRSEHRQTRGPGRRRRTDHRRRPHMRRRHRGVEGIEGVKQRRGQETEERKKYLEKRRH